MSIETRINKAIDTQANSVFAVQDLLTESAIEMAKHLQAESGGAFCDPIKTLQTCSTVVGILQKDFINGLLAQDPSCGIKYEDLTAEHQLVFLSGAPFAKHIAQTAMTISKRVKNELHMKARPVSYEEKSAFGSGTGINAFPNVLTQ